MTEFQCLKCTSRVEAKDLSEAMKIMDHAIGLSKGRPCAGGKHAPIREFKAAASVAAPEAIKVETKTETSKTAKKSTKSD